MLTFLIWAKISSGQGWQYLAVRYARISSKRNCISRFSTLRYVSAAWLPLNYEVLVRRTHFFTTKKVVQRRYAQYDRFCSNF